jgi:hypothetical protein
MGYRKETSKLSVISYIFPSSSSSLAAALTRKQLFFMIARNFNCDFGFE